MESREWRVGYGAWMDGLYGDTLKGLRNKAVRCFGNVASTQSMHVESRKELIHCATLTGLVYVYVFVPWFHHGLCCVALTGQKLNVPRINVMCFIN